MRELKLLQNQIFRKIKFHETTASVDEDHVMWRKAPIQLLNEPRGEVLFPRQLLAFLCRLTARTPCTFFFRLDYQALF